MDKRIIHLSRLEITGPLDIHTPMCVLCEVATTHNIKIPPPKCVPREVATTHNIKIPDEYDVHDLQEFIDILNKSDSHQPSVPLPLEERYQWSLVASFVNKFIDWPEEELAEAFETLRIYMIAGALPSVDNFAYGALTPSHTRKLNACCLFRICTSYHLPINFNHSIDQLAQAVKILIMELEQSRRFMTRQMDHMNEDGISHMYLSACHMIVDQQEEEKEEPVDEEMPDFYNDVNKSISLFCNLGETLKRIYPRTIGEAITLAALIFKIDISSSKDPIMEYNNLRKTHSMWVPLDSTMKHALTINPLSYQLDCYFNPVLPYELYNEDELRHLAIEEGYTPNDLRQESAYSLLAGSYLLPTFHHGMFSTIINDKTPITLENVNEINPLKVICYGTRIAGLIALTYQGLADVIKNQRNFSNPIDEDCVAFTKFNIRKLKQLCKIVRAGETQENIKEKENLLEAIQIAELFTKKSNSEARKLYVSFNEGDDNFKSDVLSCLYSLLRLAMCTRGWLEGEYPIKNAPVDNQADVDIKVSEGIVDFEHRCKKLNNEDGSNIILDLPLVKYQHEWQSSTSANDGLTLGDRLKILKDGENDEHGFSSCMRLTSTWLAGSAYRYLIVIGEEKPFVIEDLRDIS
uniref:Uncharacterized protein n=1 Tax=Marseillevirus LCMAC101 TaxID=2506602 RepID=A0A481YSV1_9VIRU|nr:MAG: uncharacterized protein LCMAC101_01590 [Marseillevirus LCMAC101]